MQIDLNFIIWLILVHIQHYQKISQTRLLQEQQSILKNVKHLFFPNPYLSFFVTSENRYILWYNSRVFLVCQLIFWQVSCQIIWQFICFVLWVFRIFLDNHLYWQKYTYSLRNADSHNVVSSCTLFWIVALFRFN